MHPALKSYLKRFLIVTAGAALLAFGTFVVTLENRNDALRKLAVDNEQVIKRQQAQLDEANRQITQMKTQMTTASTQCSNDAEHLKTSLEAFAKQAGACEALRHKLNIQGYTS